METADATEYTIYLINQMTTTQVFWCFLQPPVELVGVPGVYANSNVSLGVAPNSPATNTFTIPVQYLVGAGASNNAVGLNVKIDSTITADAALKDKFLATYRDVPPDMGPTLAKYSAAPPQSVAISTNPFNQKNNEANGWFASMSFGIQTLQGFIGMTWSPSPNQTRMLTPKLKFYVAVGSYSANTLAEWTTVSNDAVSLIVPDSFDLRESTVTYTPTGEWQVTPGAPSDPLLSSLARSLSRNSDLPEKS